MVYICEGQFAVALASCIPVSETRLCECRKQHVQDCGAAAFDGLVLIEVGEEYLVFGAHEENDWCEPERGKFYQKILLFWGNDFN